MRGLKIMPGGHSTLIRRSSYDQRMFVKNINILWGLVIISIKYLFLYAISVPLKKSHIF